METKELRLGNKIQDYADRIRTVHGLMFVEYSYMVEVKETHSRYTEDSIFGIPLTNEMLVKKMPFVDFGGGFSMQITNGSEITLIPAGVKYKFFISYYNSEGLGGNIFIREVEFVHELQNLFFAVWGFEIEIKSE